MIYRAELAYIRDVEPAEEAAWFGALDRNLELWIANLQRTTVLEESGDPAGYAMWCPRGSAGVLVTVQVLPAHRRRGHARRLLDAVAADAAATGVQRLELGVHRGNPARHLYEVVGWIRTGEDGSYLRYARDLPEPPAPPTAR